MWIRLLLVLGITAVLIQNFFVVRTNRDMRAAMERQAREMVAVGDVVPQLGGIDVDGRRILWPTTGTPTLVLSMSVKCKFCDASLPEWRILADNAKREGMNVVVVSKDPLPEVLNVLGPAEPLRQATVISDPTFQTYMLLRMATVPSTVLINSAGKVSAAWLGAVDANRAKEISASLARLK